MSKHLDVVIFGATGFTGELVAQHLARRAADLDLTWAIAGRDSGRLAAALERLDVDVPVIVADSHDRESLDAMVKQTRVVCSTVGPYALHGSKLVAACAAEGTHYCDLSGEAPWMQDMIDTHSSVAEASGARIVHSCGFDSIPSDFGVAYLHQQAGQPFRQVKMRVRAAKGGMSGGTVASMLNMMEQAKANPKIASAAKNPYALCPPGDRKGVRQPSVKSAEYDREFEAWAAPFIMAAINTRIVHRSNALLGHRYGEPFLYDEAMLTGDGLSGRLKALSIAGGLGGFMLGAMTAPTRAVLKRFLPDPGEGPDQQERENGYFNLLFHGIDVEGEEHKVRVKGQRDPGYGATSRMIGEAAIWLARHEGEPGFHTPVSALGMEFIDALTEHADFEFSPLS